METIKHGKVSLIMAKPDELLPCGECTACCTAMGVVELDKPNYAACEHLCGSGCAIYGDRPISCQAFQCLWRFGKVGDIRRRPDKLGIIVDTMPDLIRIWEVWEGAARSPQAKYLMERLEKEWKVPCVIINEEFATWAWDESTKNGYHDELKNMQNNLECMT